MSARAGIARDGGRKMKLLRHDSWNRSVGAQVFQPVIFPVNRRSPNTAEYTDEEADEIRQILEDLSKEVEEFMNTLQVKEYNKKLLEFQERYSKIPCKCGRCVFDREQRKRMEEEK